MISISKNLVAVLCFFASQYTSASCSETLKQIDLNKVEYLTSCHENFKYFEYHIYEKFEDLTTYRFIDLRIGSSKAICKIDSSIRKESCFTSPRGKIRSDSKNFFFYDHSSEWQSQEYSWSYDLRSIDDRKLTCAIGVTDEYTVHLFINQDDYTGLIDCILNFDEYLTYENSNLYLSLRKE